MATPGEHHDADEREDTELERLEAARDADLPPASPVHAHGEAAHPPGYHEPGQPPDRPGHRGPEVRRAPGQPGSR
jgi:hypothetical protein